MYGPAIDLANRGKLQFLGNTRMYRRVGCPRIDNGLDWLLVSYAAWVNDGKLQHALIVVDLAAQNSVAIRKPLGFGSLGL